MEGLPSPQEQAMTHFVADVGNSRLKCGRCDPAAVVETAVLSLEPSPTWDALLAAWQQNESGGWTLAGVNPAAVEGWADWLRGRGQVVRVLESFHDVPVALRVEHPETVGLDRLLNAAAANVRRPPRKPAILIDAGSAVTVDWLDADGVFCGGGIFPGLRMMLEALHRLTAQLPAVEPPESPPAMPGISTVPAMQAGVFGAAAGGIRYLARQLAELDPTTPVVYLTGGDAERLAPALSPAAILWPHMTLEGIRRAAVSL